jgi:hypothetical protein
MRIMDISCADAVLSVWVIALACASLRKASRHSADGGSPDSRSTAITPVTPVTSLLRGPARYMAWWPSGLGAT